MLAFDFFDAFLKLSDSKSFLKNPYCFVIEGTVFRSAQNLVLSFVIVDTKHIAVEV